MELPFVFACLFVGSLIAWRVLADNFYFPSWRICPSGVLFFRRIRRVCERSESEKKKKTIFFFPHLQPLTLVLNKCPVGHTIPDTFCAATKIKPYQIRPLFTHKSCKLSGAISVTEQSCAVPISKVKRHKSYRFCGILWCSVNTYLARRGSK